MLLIENHTKLEKQTFCTKSNTQEWIVSTVEENQNGYSFLVVPKDDLTGVYAISGAIVYTLFRESDNPDGYKMINTRNTRQVWVRKDNLTFDNFLLELMIQTALNTN
jgi:hypothetical protein